MFPTRYFPNRYFAPRYWPKVGAAPAVGTAGTFSARAPFRIADADAPARMPDAEAPARIADASIGPRD